MFTRPATEVGNSTHAETVAEEIFSAWVRIGKHGSSEMDQYLTIGHYVLPAIPRMSLIASFEEGRFAGHGGGGMSLAGGTTPFFCKSCGKTVGRKKVKPSCDVCAKCRSRGRK